MALIYISQMANGIEHFSMLVILVIYVFSSQKCLFRFFDYFLTGIFAFLLLLLNWVPYKFCILILHINSSLDEQFEHTLILLSVIFSLNWLFPLLCRSLLVRYNPFYVYLLLLPALWGSHFLKLPLPCFEAFSLRILVGFTVLSLTQKSFIHFELIFVW